MYRNCPVSHVPCPVSRVLCPVFRVPCPVSHVLYIKLCFPIYFGPQDLSRTIERNKNKISCLNKKQPLYKVSKT